VRAPRGGATAGGGSPRLQGEAGPCGQQKRTETRAFFRQAHLEVHRLPLAQAAEALGVQVGLCTSLRPPAEDAHGQGQNKSGGDSRATAAAAVPHLVHEHIAAAVGARDEACVRGSAPR
jgi:hypothetical protein